MKKLITIVLILISAVSYSQNSTKNTPKQNKFEDRYGNLVTDTIIQKNILIKKNAEIESNKKKQFLATLTPIHLCSNNNFEEFQNSSNINVLKNFLYTVEDPQNPTQCSTPISIANQEIAQYDPSQNSLMASTVISTYVDEFIGNINAFDQFALKIKVMF